VPFLLTNSAILTVLNPLETQIEEAHVDFVEECVKHFKNILTKDENGDDLADDDARLDIGRQPVKLCAWKAKYKGGTDQSSYNRLFLPDTTNRLFLSGRGDYCD
jgi:hypothetical protein